MTEEKATEAPAKKDPTKEFVVTMPNTLDHEVGDTVQLTELQASRLVNKVRPKDEVAKQSAAGRKSAAENKAIELAAEVVALTADAEKLKGDLQLLIDENKALKTAAAPK